MDTIMNIGFIGLGIRVAPMAQHLLAAGHQCFLHTQGRVPAAFASTGAKTCADAAAAACQAQA